MARFASYAGSLGLLGAFGSRNWGLGSRIKSLRYRIAQGLGHRVWEARVWGFRVWGSRVGGFRVWGLVI